MQTHTHSYKPGLLVFFFKPVYLVFFTVYLDFWFILFFYGFCVKNIGFLFIK